jgi:hypothetical protein
VVFGGSSQTTKITDVASAKDHGAILMNEKHILNDTIHTDPTKALHVAKARGARALHARVQLDPATSMAVGSQSGTGGDNPLDYTGHDPTQPPAPIVPPPPPPVSG